MNICRICLSRRFCEQPMKNVIDHPQWCAEFNCKFANLINCLEWADGSCEPDVCPYVGGK